jgi:hypothetical protein
MAESKSVMIEGDKSFFVSKGAVDRFKKDLKANNIEKLSTNDYFKEDWTYQMVSQTDTEIKVKIINQKDVASNGKEIRVLDCDERRKLLKNKLKNMRDNRSSLNNIKLSMQNKVPSELLNGYIEASNFMKKTKVNGVLLDPKVVLAKPHDYKNIVYTMLKSFGNVKTYNPIIQYFKLLAKYLEIPTENAQPKQNSQADVVPDQNPTNTFIEELRKQRFDAANTEANEELNKIYADMGISFDAQDDDKELNDILSKLK